MHFYFFKHYMINYCGKPVFRRDQYCTAADLRTGKETQSQVAVSQ